jgi:hypothetical protein
MTGMRSRDVADLAGISYRQLDYLTRHPESPINHDPNVAYRGSGVYREWTPHQAVRLLLAAHLSAATVAITDNGSPFNAYAFALLRYNDPIPTTGWVACNTEPDAGLEFSFADNPVDLMAAIETMRSALVTAYDLQELATARRPRYRKDDRAYALLVHELITAAARPCQPTPA